MWVLRILFAFVLQEQSIWIKSTCACKETGRDDGWETGDIGGTIDGGIAVGTFDV